MLSDEKVMQDEMQLLPEDDPTAEADTADVCEEPAVTPPEDTPPADKRGFSRFWKEYSYLLLCFFVPAAIMWLIHIAMGVYPFGNNSVLVLDLNGQYVYYFEGLRALLLGEGSFIYSFGRSLGGEFLGIIAYYLASPFSFIVALFPKNMITEALLTLFLLKTGLCGLTFGFYLHKTHTRNPVAAVIFSCMYALTAYAVVYQHNTMWIDNVLFLPLILLGIEEMIKHGKFKMFVITLSLAVISNYYIGYMTCIFVAVYFFYAYFTRTPEERNPAGVRFHFAKSFGRIAFFSVIVLAIASILILPAYYSLSFGKSTFSDPSFAPAQRFDFLDMLTKMYFGSYDTVRPEGLPLLYSGMLTFLLMPLYFLAPHVKIREKVGTGLLVVFFIVSFNTSTLDLVWHGFQRPNWLNYRYSFMLCFLFVLMAFKAFEKLREIGYRKVILSAAAICGLLLIMQAMDYENLPDFIAVWASLAFCGVYLCILRASTMKSEETKQTAALVMAIVVGLELFCAGYANIVALDDDVVVSKRTTYRTFIDRVEPIVEEVQAQDDSFYRMEKTMHRKTNDNLSLGMRGLSNSTSTLNESVITLLKRFGMMSKSHWTKYFGGTPVLDSLMGIKYIIAEEDEVVSPMYSELLSYNDDLIAYQNPYALSIAYGVHETLYDFDFGNESYGTPFERMNYLMGQLVGSEDELLIFESIKTQAIDYENCRTSMVVGHRKYAPEKADSTSSVTFTITAPNESMLYCYFPSDYPREVDMYVNGQSVGTFFGNETFAIHRLGAFEKGDSITVTLSLKKDDLYIATNVPFFYSLNEALFAETLDKLSSSQFEIESYTEDSFYGSITVAEDQQLIFTSIPYDDGWVVKADGAEVEKVRLLDSLMGFRLPAGEHTLSMEYRPDCIRYGVILCCGGLVTFAAVWVCDALIKRAKKKKGTAVL